MTFDRAIEILDPEHREHYESLDPVNEACRMGMEALKFVRDLIVCKNCMHCKLFEDGHSFRCKKQDTDYFSPHYDAETYFCGDGIEKDGQQEKNDAHG